MEIDAYGVSTAQVIVRVVMQRQEEANTRARGQGRQKNRT